VLGINGGAALIDREKELEEFNLLLKEPGAHLLAVSGRRRPAKTTLLLEWARRSRQPSSTGSPATPRRLCFRLPLVYPQRPRLAHFTFFGPKGGENGSETTE